MNIVVIAIFGLVLLAGLLTLGIGNRGWSWGTVAAAILALLAAGGYVYLVARVAERDRVWKAMVRKYEADVLRERDAKSLDAEGRPQPLANGKSLDHLTAEETRWRRALEQVDTWRGRAWRQASFTPPKDGEPGTIVLAEQAVGGSAAEPAAEPARGESPDDAEGEAPDDAEGEAPDDAEGEAPDDADTPVRPAGGEATPLNPGAEVSVFDDAPLEEGGRFLGVFRVVAAEFDPAARRATLLIAPAAAPDPIDLRAWSRTYEPVTVYENLPVDRWMAFYKMPGRAAADSAGAGVLDPAKSDPEELLARLERLKEEFERHETEVEGDPNDVAARLLAEHPQPGRYWAVVEFAAAHDLDETVVRRITELFAPEIEDESLIKKSFEAGETAEFDLQTAVDLGDTVKILRVVDRRPLADAFTMLLGGRVPGGEQELRADGLAVLRRRLEAEMAALDLATERLGSALGNVRGQRDVVGKDRDALEADLREWKADVEAAEKIRGAFEARLGRLSGSLAGTVEAIGRLGRELTAGVGRLTAEVDRRAPAPERGGSLPDAGRTR
jgi:hypothetical protein